MSDDTWNPGYPVLVYQEGMELPEEGTYFVVAGNGLWMHKDAGGVCSCFVPVESIDFLPDLWLPAVASFNLPKLPLENAWKIKEFFRQVVQQHRSEAATILYFNGGINSYQVHVPEQRVSHGGVEYKRSGMAHVEGMESFLRIGTIHSHCDFRAFHSGTDIGDEEDFDGLHVTFGHNHLEEFTISATVVVNGNRTKIDPTSCIEGIELVKEDEDVYRFVSIEDSQKDAWRLEIQDWLTKVSPYGSHSPVAFFNSRTGPVKSFGNPAGRESQRPV